LEASKKYVHLCNAKKISMLLIQLHIEVRNWFSPKGDDTDCGACKLTE